MGVQGLIGLMELMGYESERIKEKNRFDAIQQQYDVNGRGLLAQNQDNIGGPPTQETIMGSKPQTLPASYYNEIGALPNLGKQILSNSQNNYARMNEQIQAQDWSKDNLTKYQDRTLQAQDIQHTDEMAFKQFQHDNPSAFQSGELENQRNKLAWDQEDTKWNRENLTAFQRAQLAWHAKVNERFGRVPAGFVMNEQGTAMVPVPGSPAYRTQQEVNAKLEGVKIASDNALSNVDSILNNPNLGSSVGMIDKYVAKIPGTPSFNFAKNVETLKAQLFGETIPTMRGLGSLSDAEGKKIESMVSALDTGMTEKEFKRSLKNIREYLTKSSKTVQSTYEKPLGNTTPRKPLSEF